jgi:hypothetical protein
MLVHRRSKHHSCYVGHGQAGSTRKCRKFEDPYLCKHGRGNCIEGNTSKRKDHNYKGDISEVHGDLEESLEWLRTSHR